MNVDQLTGTLSSAGAIARLSRGSEIPQSQGGNGVAAADQMVLHMVNHLVELLVDSLGTWLGSRRTHLGARRSAVISLSPSR
jgi:hypothetical protein